MVDFGSRLRLLRQTRGMTQKQLSDTLSLTKSVVSAYETGMRLPSYDILIRISVIFGVTTDYLLDVNHKRLVDISGLSDSDIQMIISLIDRLKASS